MPAPNTVAEFLELVRKSGVADANALDALLNRAGRLPDKPDEMAELLVREGLLTSFQTGNLLKGKWRSLVLSGKYVILEPLGSGGMGTVYLCLHLIMKRKVALKVLPAAQAADPVTLERFHREARAVAQLRHPNIVGAYDVDRDDKFHFLVMEHVDGSTLQQIVQKTGPLGPIRAAHYIHQTALGFQHAHEAGLVHRDVKPANILVDREGTVKILDLGLARFFHDKTDLLTQKFEAGVVLGTADYLAPEQAVDSHNVDGRADIYSLGVTFYFLLAGSSPYQDGTIAQKLIWHQMRDPKPIRTVRPEVPEGLAAAIARMLDKDPNQRYQTMAEVAEAVAPWTRTAIPPPQEQEMPRQGRDSSSVNSAKMRPPSSRTSVTARLAGARSPATLHASSSVPLSTGEETPPPDITVSEGQSDTAPWGPKENRGKPPAPSIAAAKSSKTAWAIGAGVIAIVLAVGFSVFNSLAPFERVAVTVPKPSIAVEGELAAVGAVSIKKEVEGWRIQTPKYDAFVDATDGCLSSFRVGGVEFLKNGGKLFKGKTVARGGYFYSERDGHQGAVKLPEVKESATNVLVATGDKFSVRYEFAPDTFTLTARNSTDHTANYFLIFDRETVGEVIDGNGTKVQLPTKNEAEPPDGKWRTTTWLAGRSRVKVEGGTRIWGPFSEFASEVLEVPVTTYSSATIVLTPTLLPESDQRVAPGGVLITRDGSVRRVRTELYEAVVEGDGCTTSLRIDGVEVLRSGVEVSRGLYLLRGGANVRLGDIKQPASDTLTAESDSASVRYRFEPNKMTCTVENKADNSVTFYAVFDRSVAAVRNAKGDWAKTPTGDEKHPMEAGWERSTWFAGQAKFTIAGGTKIWGPWPTPEQGYQVWDAVLGPREKRTVTVEVDLADAAEVAKVAALTGMKPASAAGVVLDTPKDYQIFQRRNRRQGSITFRGRVRPAFDRLEYRIVGKSLDGLLPGGWTELPIKPGTPFFDTTVTAPSGGWYQVEVRALKDGQGVAEARVAHVGVGEIFVGAGQSNSTNCGEQRIQQTSGMTSTFGGSDWRLADDPQPGVHDNSTGGSYWPAFGDAMFAKYGVPIGIASTGHSGSSVKEWQTDGELFRWTTGRMKQLGREGFRAVLWHQGESDVGMAAEEYTRRMRALIQDSRRAIGWDVPWFVAQVSYHNPKEPSFPGVRAAQKGLWTSGIALEGPDTDTLAGDNRDRGGQGIHFSPKGLRAHGAMWADKVGAHLDKSLAK